MRTAMTEPSRRRGNLQAVPFRIVGFGFELPPLPVALTVGSVLSFRARPSTAALSIDGGPLQTGRLL